MGKQFYVLVPQIVLKKIICVEKELVMNSPHPWVNSRTREGEYEDTSDDDDDEGDNDSTDSMPSLVSVSTSTDTEGSDDDYMGDGPPPTSK